MAAFRIPRRVDLLWCLAVLLGGSSSALAEVRPIDPDAALQAAFGEREVVFAARAVGGDTTDAYSPARIDERHPPFSTFKIPNFLIALDTAVVTDIEAQSDWDPAHRPASDYWPANWRQAQSLVTAFRRSAVWYFRDIALEVGGPRYRSILKRLGYGNAVAGDGSDDFWLDGSLRISPAEQVGFIERLLDGESGFDQTHIEALQSASLLDETADCRFHGKTGAGPVTDDFDGPFEGWLVGWTDCAGAAPVAYALWVRGESFGAIRRFRQTAATQLLTRIGAFHGQE
jgi:beta-lactamase class D